MIQINPALVPRWYLMSFGRGEEKYNYIVTECLIHRPQRNQPKVPCEKRLGVFQKRCGIADNPLDTPQTVGHSSMSRKPQEQVKTQKARWLTWEHTKGPMNQRPHVSKCIIVSVPEWDDQFSFGSAWIGSLRLSNNETSFDFGLSVMSLVKRKNDDDCGEKTSMNFMIPNWFVYAGGKT